MVADARASPTRPRRRTMSDKFRLTTTHSSHYTRRKNAAPSLYFLLEWRSFFAFSSRAEINSGVDKLEAFWSTNRRTVALCLDVRYPDTSKVYHAHWRKYQHNFHSQISINLCQPTRPGFRSVHYSNKHFHHITTPTSTRSLPYAATDSPSSPSVTHSFLLSLQPILAMNLSQRRQQSNSPLTLHQGNIA